MTNLAQVALKRQAETLRENLAQGRLEARRRAARLFPDQSDLTSDQARLVVAVELGLPKDKAHDVGQLVLPAISLDDRRERFLRAACSANIARTERMLAEGSLGEIDDVLVAIVCGDSDIVERQMARLAASVNQPQGPLQWTPLCYLCFSCVWRIAADTTGLLRVLDLLLAEEADPNIALPETMPPQTCLYAATQMQGNEELAKRLLSAGADPNDGVAIGGESLYHAAESRDTGFAQLILAAQPNADAVSYALGRKLDFDDHEGTRLFLESGADPNYESTTGRGDNRVHGAVLRRRRAETIELLCEYGGEYWTPNNDGHTAYALAMRIGHSSAVDTLRRLGASDDDLQPIDWLLSACCNDDDTTIEYLLTNDPQLPEQLNEADHRLLPHAARFGMVDAVRALLAIGCDVSTGGEEGMTAAHWAVWNGNAELTALLIDRGAPLEVRNMYGGSVLNCCVYGAAHNDYPYRRVSGNGEATEVGDGDCDFVSCVETLLSAGAEADSVSSFPSGIEDIDRLLGSHQGKHQGNMAPSPPHHIHPHVKLADSLHERLFANLELPEDVALRMDALAQHLKNRFSEGCQAAEQFVAIFTHGFHQWQDHSPAVSLPLTESRRIIAVAHGFNCWEEVDERLGHAVNDAFDEAVQAIITGDTVELHELLEDCPSLVLQRSTSGHRATLLHYVAANGVEVWQQKSPPNSANIARQLLDAGAPVNAVCEAYGGGPRQTTLALLETSSHPADAGVADQLAQLLRERGAVSDAPGL